MQITLDRAEFETRFCRLIDPDRPELGGFQAMRRTINPNGLSLLLATAIRRPDLWLRVAAERWVLELLDGLMLPLGKVAQDVLGLADLSVQKRFFVRAILKYVGLAECRGLITEMFSCWQDADESLQHILLQHMRQGEVGELSYMLGAPPSSPQRSLELWQCFSPEFLKQALELCVLRVPDVFLRWGGQLFDSHDPRYAGLFDKAALQFMELSADEIHTILDVADLAPSTRELLRCGLTDRKIGR